jgi:hypothetical protein
MRSLVLATLVATFVLAPLATATTGDGTFLVGTPVTATQNQCATPPTFQNGAFASCAGITVSTENRSYSLTANGLGGQVLGLTACFYDAGGTLLRPCDKVQEVVVPTPNPPSLPEPPSVQTTHTLFGIVPAGASKVAITADAGVMVAWHLRY